MSLPEEIDCATLKAMLDGPADGRPVVIDVRHPQEHLLAPFPGATLIPLHELAERAEELVNHRGKAVVMVCHMGMRSRAAAAFARDKGLDATSLLGGIEAWACEIDPSIPRY
jgi:rhodanese-related sulfurtransferase